MGPSAKPLVLLIALAMPLVGCRAASAILPSSLSGLPSQWEPQNAGQDEPSSERTASEEMSFEDDPSDEAIDQVRNFGELFEEPR